MLRLVRVHRGWFAFSTTTLAVAVGVNVVVFTVVNALWIRPLPFPDADRVVAITSHAFVGLDAPVLKSIGGAVAGQVMTDGLMRGLRPAIVFENAPQAVEAVAITPEYFRVLGVAIRGREFAADDNRTEAEPVAIISDRLWSRGFGSRSEVIGAVVGAKPRSIRIVGVAPPGFHGVRRGENADVWIPKNLVPRFVPAAEVSAEALPMMVFARLRSAQTASEVTRRLREAFRNDPFLATLTVVPVKAIFGTSEAPTTVIRESNSLVVVGGLGMLVLLGGWATLAALVLVHYERRRAELAVRIAIGASRVRLVATLLGELSWVAAAGTAGAMLVAVVGSQAVPSLSLPGGVDLGRLDLAIDWRVLGAAIVTTVLVVMAAAGLPLSWFTRGSRASELFAGNPPTASAASQRVRQTLLALHVCGTIVVLVAAGLFVRAVNHGFSRAPGFDAERTVFVDVQVMSPFGGLGSGSKDVATERTSRIREALRSAPGVEYVAEGMPPVGPEATELLGRPVVVKTRSEQRSLLLGRLDGSANLLSALGVPMMAGRGLTVADANAEPVPAVVTSSLAKVLWPAESPLGQVMSTSWRGGRFIVVGTARDFAFGSLVRPAAGILVTARRGFGVPFEPKFVLRGSHPEAIVGAALDAVRTTVPDAPWAKAATGRDLIARDLGRQRLGAWFFSGFGLAALLLGVGGVFGLVAYLVESRQREFGFRLAVGATACDLMRRGVMAALVPVSIGVAAGLLCAAWVAQLFRSLLAGLSALDPLTYLAVAMMMLCCAASAGLGAAWRLRRLMPADALRTN